MQLSFPHLFKSQTDCSFSLFGVDLKENKVSLYRNARTNDLPVTLVLRTLC